MAGNYVYVSYGISCWIQHLERQKHLKKKNSYSLPEAKAANICKIIWEGKAKWHEIMSMFPTELAAESNT